MRADLRSARAALAAAVAFALAACAVGPDYRPPRIETPVAFVGAQGYDAQPPVPAFWSEFEDPVLENLVAAALAANHDLRIADANLARVRALRREQQFDLSPTITSAASYRKVRLEADAAPDGARTFESYGAGFEASWELDVFGRTRREMEARDAEVGAALAARRAASVAVTSEVARTYFEFRGLQLRRTVAERNLANQQGTVRITEAKFDGGRGTKLDVERARAQLAATRATLPVLDTALTAARYRLAVLTGRPPAALDETLATPAALPALPRLVAVGTPETWLRRRPDVARAERELAAATARIGVAVGDLFPRIGFTGTAGVGGASFGALDDGGSDYFTLVPGLTWAAFDLGRVRARIAASEADADRALAEYERTVLRALEETEGALHAYRDALVRREALGEAATASTEAARLARVRHAEGAADFLDVLDAERTLLDSEDRLALAEAEARTRLIAVYTALGAGWDPADPAPVRRAAGR
jgi:multidrug efflux system outer membrane protein